MMAFLGLVAAVNSHRQMPDPLLWMNLKGEMLVAGHAVQPQFNPGAARVRTKLGYAYDFSGERSGILFGDMPALRLTQSITVSAWLFPRHYAQPGNGSEILFRGDDRNGFDPYSFVVEGDGTVNFQIHNEHDQGAKVKADLPLNRWSHVLGSFDANTGALHLWVNGEQVAFTKTLYRPFAALLPEYTPGVGMGNIQNNRGPHNQPYNGVIADLRMYPACYTPQDIDFDVIGRPDQITPF